MKKIWILCCFLLLGSYAIAQETSTDTDTTSSTEISTVNLYVDSRLDALAHKPKNTAPKANKALRVRGYRVQIYNGTSKQEADKIKNDFIKIYPRVRSYLTFHAPNYRLKVGDFKTRAEAEAFVSTASRLFRTTMIIPDIVNNN